MDEEFSAWLNYEITRRGWSQSELARRGSISNQMVSMVIAGQAKPGLRFCKGVAKALEISEAEVLQRAGRLPKTGNLLPVVADWNRRLLALSDRHRNTATTVMETALSSIEQMVRATESL